VAGASKDLVQGIKSLEEATNAYVEALAYYTGSAAERFANDRIRQAMAAAGQTYQFRFAAIPVKVMSKRCRIANVNSDKEAVSARLEEIRDANAAEINEPLIMRKMFTFGDAYALVWPVESTEDADQVDGETVDVAAELELRQAGVEISYQSPLSCRVIYDAEDGRRPRFGIRRWMEATALGEVWHAEVWYADRVEPWATKPGTKGNNAEEWEPYAEDEDGIPVPVEEGVNWPLEHDWGEIPIKHARHADLPYGEPAHIAAYGPQDAITKAISTQVTVDIEAHGWPERWRILEDARILETGREPVDWGDRAVPDAPEARTGPERSGRRRGSGLEHVYAGTKNVGEYRAPDPGELVGPIEAWLRWMSVVTETPLYELDPTVQMSGVSREKADAPLRAKEKDAKTYLDGFWREVYSLAVRMSGMADPGVIAVHWAPPEVTMETEWWTTAQARVNLGVPVRQILQEANYLPEQVDAWLDAQGEEMALIQRIGVLEKLGAAIQTLGVGIQLGVVDQSTVNSLVQRVVGEIKAEPGRDAT
jgi:hypothetical protein